MSDFKFYPLSRPESIQFDKESLLEPYNLFLSFKFDGIRFSIQDGKVFSRTGKIIPNNHIRNTILSWNLPDGVDGELISGTNFQETTSAVMSVEGNPIFSASVFDIIPFNDDESFKERYDGLMKLFSDKFELEEVGSSAAYHTKIESLWLVKHHLVNYYEDIKKWIDIFSGAEGVVLRSYHGRYYDKMWKIKNKCNSEGKIVDIIQLKRKTGKLDEQLGSFWVEDVITKKRFSVGTGLTKKQRIDFWNSRNDLMGKYVTYQYDYLSTHKIPRFPRFIGIRDEKDIIDK